MPDYRRWYVPGGTYFFSLVTEQRAPIFRDPDARKLLGDAMRKVRRERPYSTLAIVLLPDHLHCVWTLPPGDTDFSTRWKSIKAGFTEGWLTSGGREARPTLSKLARGERGVWQRRFWEHAVRDEPELNQYCDYIHFNPVKHGHVSHPADWPWSSFARFVREGHYPADWGFREPEGLPEQVGE